MNFETVGWLIQKSSTPSTPWYLANGIAPLAAYQAKRAANYAASLINLVNPGTYNLTEGNGAVTWDAINGWQFVSGLSKYLDTGLVPVATGQPWSMMARFADVVGDGNSVIGAYSASQNFLILPTSGGVVAYGNGDIKSVAPGVTTGRLGFAGNIAYRNGIAEPGTINPAAGGIIASIIIGGAKAGFGPGFYVTAKIYAAAIWNQVLTPAQFLAADTALATL